MKNLVIRTVIALALLLTLGAFFGGVSPTAAIPAHATSFTPDTARVDCSAPSNSAELVVDSDYGGDIDCFAGSGAQGGLAIYNVGWVCTEGDSGYVVYHDDGASYYVQYDIPDNQCLWVSGTDGVYVNVVVTVELD